MQQNYFWNLGRKNKPKSDTLFSNLIQEIIKIKQNGLIFKFENKSRKIFVDLYGFEGDVPAKVLVMNHTNFNGYFGCPYCFIKGKLKLNF